jgi:hypothetical protein
MAAKLVAPTVELQTKQTPGSLLSLFSYGLLVLISQLHLAIYIATWLDGHVYQYKISVLVRGVHAKKV